LFEEHFCQEVQHIAPISNESSSIKSTEKMMHKFGKNHKWDDFILDSSLTDFNLFMEDVLKDDQFKAFITVDMNASIKVSKQINDYFHNNQN